MNDRTLSTTMGTNNRSLTRHAVLAVLGAAFALLPACTTNPATGKSIFTLGMSREAEVALGSQAAPQFTQEFGGAVPDKDLQAYVVEVGSNLAAQTEADFPTLPWEFTLLNSDVINAFALPGGKVFISRGLAAKLDNEAQLAGVLGHEVGHVTAQHGAQRIAQQTAFQVGTVAAAVIVESSGDEDIKRAGTLGIPALQVGGTLVMLSYGRGEELESDALGMRYMTKIGYDPSAQGDVMRVLKAAAGGGGGSDFFSTHPDPDKRIDQVARLVSSEYAFTQNNPQYGRFQERYQQRMLRRLAMLPPAPDASAIAAAYAKLGHPSLWCAHCKADDATPGKAACASQAPEAGPVPPRQGVYAFFAPAAPR